jgi:hypothetical protein
MKAYGGVDTQIHIFLTSALDGGEWLALHLGRFTLAETAPAPIAQEAEWNPEPVWTTWRRENSWPYCDSNSYPSVVQSVDRRYTDYAIAALPASRWEDNIKMCLGEWGGMDWIDLA